MDRRWFRSGLRLSFAAAVIVIIVLSLLPSGSLPNVGISDKFQHLAAYALLAALGWAAFPTRRAVFRLILALPLLGIALEFGQMLVPNRSAEVVDALVGTLGTCVVLVPALVRDAVLRRSARARP
jgi:VanZ family protein